MMSSLKKNECFSDILMELYSIPESGDFFGHALSILDARIPSSISGYWFVHLDANRLEGRTVSSHDGQTLPDLDELAKLLQSHPCLKLYNSNRTGPVWCTTDLMSEKEWKQLPIYNEVYRPLGVVHDTHVRFYSGELCVIFAFSDARKTDEQHCRLLNSVAPHLKAAHSAFRIQQKRRRRNLPGNMIQLSADGQLLECQSLARSLLDRYFPHSKRQPVWHLPEDVRRWIACEIQRTTAEAGGKTATRTLIVRTHDAMLRLHLIRQTGDYVIVLEESAALEEINLLEKLGLSHREAEVLSWVARGKQNSDVASIMNIKTATVRKHMEHIFEKMGCETRGAAERLALQSINHQIANCITVKCLSCKRPICISCDGNSPG
jgi:DNA-binding CsgD family transcriptional regulator